MMRMKQLQPKQTLKKIVPQNIPIVQTMTNVFFTLIDSNRISLKTSKLINKIPKKCANEEDSKLIPHF